MSIWHYKYLNGDKTICVYCTSQCVYMYTCAWPHTQMDNLLSGYKRISETIQAYMCMTYSCNNVSEHLWESLMELFMLLIQTSDSLTDVQQLLSDNHADSNLWTSVRESPLEHTEPWFCGCLMQSGDSITDVQWLLSHDLADSITEQFVRKILLGHAQLWSCGCLIQAHEVPHRCSAIIICKIMRQ